MTTLPVAADETVHWTLLEARGVDATAFLQGQLSCDLTDLSDVSPVKGLLLSPAGDVITSLECRHHDEGVDLVVRGESASAVLAALRRFLMRTKCTFEQGGETAGPYATTGEQVRRGEPGPHEFARGVAAHAFGQAFVDRHVSFTKGCYTGQELVGRLDARGGNVPFRLARVTGDDLERMEAVVRSAGPTGERALQGLTTVVGSDALSALALVHRSLLDARSPAVIDGVAIEILHDVVE